ncbi:trypsin-like peptidase domain-containing protein [Calothrix sp. FACHB-1219]|uniref:S1 family peptidase n=1 Tax=unclassified Calothrix TaxID=2619626 RepID=UPI0016854969|nr:MULTISPECIES: serine protease [unclassified Calothrix]MBD2201904.1 trypsin-like peptidase domain-containing protein [Calothrix sp. FACHB-168]MBD2216939.1 trypsin-like peptidase domain-containing protein [Calothrix sp. FACHB-1219]
MKYQENLAAILAGTTVVSAIVIMQPVAAFAMTGEEINNIAREVTVLIKGEQGHGSGVIISQENNTYHVLTAYHVVAQRDNYKVVTADKKAYQLTKITRLPNVDMAVVQFSSNQNYKVAKIANSQQAVVGNSVFISGWPAPGSTKQLVRQFTSGQISGTLDQPIEGYQMIYTNVTRKGMSGGPVFDGGGRVVGIHGLGDTEDPDLLTRQGQLSPDTAQNIASLIKPGFNYAIPINTFLNLAAQQKLDLALKLDSQKAPNTAVAYTPSAQPDSRDVIDDVNNVLADVNQGINVIDNTGKTINQGIDAVNRVLNIFR